MNVNGQTYTVHPGNDSYYLTEHAHTGSIYFFSWCDIIAIMLFLGHFIAISLFDDMTNYILLWLLIAHITIIQNILIDTFGNDICWANNMNYYVSFSLKLRWPMTGKYEWRPQHHLSRGQAKNNPFKLYFLPSTWPSNWWNRNSYNENTLYGSVKVKFVPQTLRYWKI